MAKHEIPKEDLIDIYGDYERVKSRFLGLLLNSMITFFMKVNRTVIETVIAEWNALVAKHYVLDKNGQYTFEKGDGKKPPVKKLKEGMTEEMFVKEKARWGKTIVIIKA